MCDCSMTGSQEGRSSSTTTNAIPAWLEGPSQQTARLLDDATGSVIGQGIQSGQLTDQVLGATPYMHDAMGLMKQLGSGDNSTFMNPYQDQVVDSTLRRVGEAEGQALNNVRSQAAMAGAFGGSRHGLAEGTTRGQFADARYDAVGNLNRQGFLDSFNLGSQMAGNLMGGAMAVRGAENEALAAPMSAEEALRLRAGILGSLPAPQINNTVATSSGGYNPGLLDWISAIGESVASFGTTSPYPSGGGGGKKGGGFF